jgi:hypothetical protein
MNGHKAKQLRKAAKIAAQRKFNGDERAEKYVYKMFKKYV